MNTLKSTATNHPFLFVLGLTIAWFVLGMILIILASSALHRPYGDSTALTIGRLAVTACLLGLVWRLGWLEASGVSRLGGWQVWLLALAGAVYFSGASLYSFYGKFAFDFSSLVRLSSPRDAVLSQFVVALSEEILFRGAVLYGLLRVWGRNRQGVFASAILSSLLFAAMHLTQVFTDGVSLSLVLLLVLETWVISIWWAALVLSGGSIWPAVIGHFMVNAAVAVQVYMAPAVEPEFLAYGRLLLFSLLLGLPAIGMLARLTSHRLVLEAD